MSYIVSSEGTHHLARAIQLDFNALVEVLRSWSVHNFFAACGWAMVSDRLSKEHLLLLGRATHLLEFWLRLRHIGGDMLCGGG